MTTWAKKRFWTDVAVRAEEGGFGVRLDDKPLRTPSGKPLVVPTRPVAEVMAGEWRAQDGEVRPLTMPFTRIANTAIDKVAPQREQIAAMLAAYGDSDLVCYRAEGPAVLVERQSAAWDPLIDWLDTAYGARLRPRTGVMHAPQDPEALSRLAAEVGRLDHFALAAFHDLVALSGSLAIGLAALNGAIPADVLWRASRVDEDWQSELWGDDEEAAEAASERRSAFLNAHHFIECLREPPGSPEN